jgi:penicillin-binding protein 1A
MTSMDRLRTFRDVSIAIVVLIAVATGIAFGMAMAGARNFRVQDSYTRLEEDLPSVILDTQGNTLKELFAEKRVEVPLEELPKHLVYALLAREDKNFYEHNGVDPEGFLRAAFNIVTGRYFSGFSTITMQVAGHLYANRGSDTTMWEKVQRKIREIWFAFQMERNYSKDQIMELYLNKFYFGHQNYGVEAASRFYFHKPAAEMTVAESAILVAILARPNEFSPVKNPDLARPRQVAILDAMVEEGYVSREEADTSFEVYWANYDATRAADDAAIFENQGIAPYFTAYVTEQFNSEIFVGSGLGGADIFTDGYRIHTTLDSRHQALAEQYMQSGLESLNASVRAQKRETQSYASSSYLPMIGVLSLAFDIPEIHYDGVSEKQNAVRLYDDSLNAMVDVIAMISGNSSLKDFTRISTERKEEKSTRETVEGALITIDNESGYITAMYGGSDFSIKKFNRATDGTLMPGSVFKPLYYTEAIESETFTPASMFFDARVSFQNLDGTSYTPDNYGVRYRGPVLLRRAIALSLNVPSLKLLEGIGIENGIEMAVRLLDKEDEFYNETLYPRKYTLGLGTTAVSPLEIAKAFATFPNAGRRLEPIAISYIEDRNGKLVVDHAQNVLRELRSRDTQLISPQTAYIMTDLLTSVAEYGTLSGRVRDVGGFGDMAVAAKTGTSENWHDAWTVGFTPYYTTAIWFGFDEGGESLGRVNYGGWAAGRQWAPYMKDIHEGLAPLDFERPKTGLVDVQIALNSGLRPTQEHYNRGLVTTELFIAGTEPKEYDTLLGAEEEREANSVAAIRSALLFQDLDFSLGSASTSTPIGSFNPFLLDTAGSDDGTNPLLDDSPASDDTADFSLEESTVVDPESEEETEDINPHLD